MTIATHAAEYLGVDTVAHVEKDGWHRVGKQITPDQTPTEVLATAGIDWTVSKTPIYCKVNDTEQIIPGRFALTRDSDGKVFDTVGKDWRPNQNSEIAAFFESFCKAGDLKPYAAGALDGGRNVFFVAEIAKEFTFLGNDKQVGYICFSNPHKCGAAISIATHSNRLWCANQIRIDGYGSRSNRETVRFTHVARNGFKVDLAQKIVAQSREAFDRYEADAHKLAGGRASPGQLETYFRKVFGLEKPDTDTDAKVAREIEERNQVALERILEAHEDQPGIQCGTGTWWHGLNTVSFLTDHGSRGSEERQFQSANFGTGCERKRKALALALEFAN